MKAEQIFTNSIISRWGAQIEWQTEKKENLANDHIQKYTRTNVQEIHRNFKKKKHEKFGIIIFFFFFSK